MQILMLGTGYVGLVTGSRFAEMGHTVTCLDIDSDKINNLLLGHLPIYEPGLEAIVQKNIKQKRLHFTTNYEEAIASAKIYFITVPTPSKADGSCDVSIVESTVTQIAKHMTGYCILVNKSTVPIGTGDQMKTMITQLLKENGQRATFDVVSNPEFLKEGTAVQDCLYPDRIIIGSDSTKATEIIKEIYAPCKINDQRILTMHIRSAEMAKYAANAMLATRISFMNEIANICKKVGAFVNEVREGIGLDQRIGSSFLYPGVGYGGSCFPKDVQALISTAKEVGSNPRLLEATHLVNEQQKKELFEQIDRYFSPRGGLKNKTFAIWGLSFKPNTDDIREAPSLTIIENLIAQGASLRLFDPVAMPNAKKILKNQSNITWCSNEFDAASQSDAIVLITEWEQFRTVDLEKVFQNLKGSVFFDGRNQYEPKEMKTKGFDYISIGMPDQLQ